MSDKLKILEKQNQSEFSYRYACWANNHNGWSKMKKTNRRIAKAKMKRELRREIEMYKGEVK